MTAEECIEKIVSIVCDTNGPKGDIANSNFNRIKLHRILQTVREYKKGN